MYISIYIYDASRSSSPAGPFSTPFCTGSRTWPARRPAPSPPRWASWGPARGRARAECRARPGTVCRSANAATCQDLVHRVKGALQLLSKRHK